MDARNRAHDVHSALRRAKRKMSSLQNELSEKESFSESEEELRGLAQAHSNELRDSLVDMYKANPKVNEELKQRLPSPVKQHSTESASQLRELEASSTTLLGRTVSEALAEDLSRGGLFVPQTKVSLLSHCGEPRAARSVLSPDSRENAPAKMMEEEEEEGHVARVDVQAQAELEQDAGPLRRPILSPRDHSEPSPKSAREVQGSANASGSFTSAKHPPVLDKEKNIAFLLKELDSLRDLNKKLQDRLALKERELEERAVDGQLLESELEARACEKAGALVEEIYTAQRERDQAVMARLRLANEERDEALLRANRLQQAAAELENINPEENDADLEELLNRINGADSALGIERSGAVIVDRLQKARERRKKITAEEMNAVIEERDAALAKCRRLEQDLHHAKEQSQTWANSARHPTAENNQEHARKEELEAVSRERDVAVERSQGLEEELQSLRAHYSLHQSLSQEASLKEQFDSTLNANSEALHTQEGQLTQDTLHQEQLMAQIQALASEHQSTQAQLKLAREAEKEASEKVQKLERLVEVLRKKVGTGSVRTVI
ncbi:mirror-image polydactyly gene 1 protein isoform X1 [Anguilla anguilla]|uniref:mirror-image polydactyly gene 1 protein isoform X1 n=3 Tax=Anguilla anguilla TaxID=7936 RepID=UPI0015B07D38|nr:mirror-image polydactyly gene 1 protein isoform X1 [Anguilla anguilla]